MINGLRTPPLINGVEPAWANLTVNIAGVPSVAIRSLDYGDEQKTENLYGAGQQPIGRGYGNITTSASVTLLLSEVEAIRKASPTGRLQDIAPFDIIVNFMPVNSTTIINHKIRNCQFTDNKVATKQDDVDTEVPLTLLPSHIDWK